MLISLFNKFSTFISLYASIIVLLVPISAFSPVTGSITFIKIFFAKNILMKVIDPVTGEKAEIGTRRTIIEAYKDMKVENLLNKDINIRLKNNNILRFY